MKVENVQQMQLTRAIRSADSLLRGFFHAVIASRIDVDEVEWMPCEADCGHARPRNGQSCQDFIREVSR